MVADQTFGGLAGALLVDPPPGQGPDVPTVEDRVLLVTDTTLDSGGRVVEVGAMDRAMGRQGDRGRPTAGITRPRSPGSGGARSGNRVDVVVRPDGTGAYPLVADAVDRGDMGAMMGGGTTTGGPLTLATLAIAGTPVTALPLPATLPAEAVPPDRSPGSGHHCHILDHEDAGMMATVNVRS